MTKQQVETFKRYVQEKDSEFYAIMDTVCVFSVSRDHEDHYYLLENAFGPVLPSEENKKKYFSLLGQYKKEHKIYGAVADIGVDFWDYLWRIHEKLAFKLNGNFDVILENGKHKPVIKSNVLSLTNDDIKEFETAWTNFSNALITV
jgi:hypothetical protein